MLTVLRRACLVMTMLAAGCATPGAADDSSQSDDAITAADPAGPEGVVRRYYGAATAADPAAALEPITAENVVLEAPSVYLLNPLGGTDKVRGKAAFVKAVAGASFLLSSAKIAPPGSKNDAQSEVALAVVSAPGAAHPLVMSRILLPLPNGDLLTQVEMFEVANGQIVHLQSYYDSARFARALPAVALAKLKQAFGASP